VAAAAILFLWLAFFSFVTPYNPDEVIYKIVVADVVDGHWPYSHLFLNRQPLVYLAYLPAGLGASIEAQRIVAAFAAAASVPAFFALAKRWLSERQVSFAVPGYCILLANPYMLVATNVEAFLLLPLIGAIVAPSAVVAGILIGAALMLKLTVLPIVPAILFMRRADLRVTVIAAIATCALLSLPFVAVWGDFWAANVTFSFDYARQSASDRLANAPFYWPVLLGALPVWVAVAVGVARERRWVVWIFLAGSVAAVKSTGYNFGHYYVLMAPAAALLAGAGFDDLLRRGRLARAVLVPSALMSTAAIFSGFLLLAFDSDRDRLYDDVVAEIDRHPGELYMLGTLPEIYMLADRQPERQYFFSIPLVFNERWGEETRADLLACPPDLLVIPKVNWTQVDWTSDVADAYRTRMEFKNASLLTDPERVCAD